MRRQILSGRASLFLLLLALSVPISSAPAAGARTALRPASAQQAEIGVNGFFSVDRAKQGSAFQAAIVMEIPEGLHVNANRPLGKYAVPTTVKVEAPPGIRVSPISYPRAMVRSFRFSESGPAERLAVYQGRAVMRFNITVPAGFETGVTNIRVRVNYQSCSETVCYPPAKQELMQPSAIVGPGEPVQRINGRYFGGARGGRRR